MQGCYCPFLVLAVASLSAFLPSQPSGSFGVYTPWQGVDSVNEPWGGVDVYVDCMVPVFCCCSFGKESIDSCAQRMVRIYCLFHAYS